jgi:hypothetical protein
MATAPAIAPILFNPAALTLFFEGADAMALSNCICLCLAIEGILIPNDFINFDNNGLDAIFTNLAKPPKIEATRPADCQAGRLLEIMTFEVSAKSKLHLKGAMKIAKFYKNINWTLDPDNMTWFVINCFLEQGKALMERKKEDVGLPPKLTKSSPVHKWLELMGLYLGKKVRGRISYIVHLDANVPAIAPPRQAGEPHSKMYESIEGDLTAHLLHTHTLFKVNNGTVFDLVESTTRGSDVAPTIAPFCKTQNGHGVMLALKSQHAGRVIWDCLVKEAEHTLSNTVWSGITPMTLAQHMGMHCHAWITLTECAVHIPVGVPNDCGRVTYLMDSLKTIDPTVLAAIAAVCQDEADKCVNFENTFAYLVPVCPFTAKTAKKTGKVAFDTSVLGTSGKTQGGLGGGNANPGKGSTSVALRYHCHKEFHALNREQKDDLCK